MKHISCSSTKAWFKKYMLSGKVYVKDIYDQLWLLHFSSTYEE